MTAVRLVLNDDEISHNETVWNKVVEMGWLGTAIPEEHGGMGLGPLANALVQMELGQSHLGALSMNSQGPDDATMLTLLAHGTDYQKEKFLKPILNGEKRVCYSMTEKAAGADATGMQTRAEKDGNSHYVLNGEKWYSSAASVADIAVVMAKTNPEAPRHERHDDTVEA